MWSNLHWMWRSIDPAALTIIGSWILKPLCVTIYIPRGPLIYWVQSWNLLGKDHWPLNCHGFDLRCWSVTLQRWAHTNVSPRILNIWLFVQISLFLKCSDKYGDLCHFPTSKSRVLSHDAVSNVLRSMLSPTYKVAQCCLVSYAGKLNHIIYPNFE